MWYDDETSSGYSSDDSNTDGLLESVVTCNKGVENEDAWDTTIRTTIVPTTLRRSSYTGEIRNLVYATEPPRSGLSPHGYSMKTWVHNVKKAVASENTSHLTYCMATYFAWFNIAESLGDSGVVRVVPVRNKELAKCLQEQSCSGGIFNNRWSAFLHQQLHLVIFGVLFELVGVCGPTLIRRLHSLWRDYELSLFVYPQRSLSKLLTMAKTIVDAHKNGSVYFAASVFADTALARRKRDQVTSNPHVLRYYIKSAKAEAVISVLSQLKPTYFKQRHRKRLYKEWYTSQDDDTFLHTGNITQLIQSLPISDKKVSKIIARQRDVALLSSRSTPLADAFTESLQDADFLYSFIIRRPNVFACRKLCTEVLTYCLVYCHLLSHLVSSGVDVWSPCRFSTEEVSHAFCKDLLDTIGSTSLVMIYGVTAERSSQVERDRGTQVPRYRKRKLKEQEESQTSEGLNTVAISHQQTYPASTCTDGYLRPADFTVHCNYNHDIFPELESLYFTSANFSYFLRYYNKPQHAPEIKITTDSAFIDLTRLSPCGANCFVGYVQKHTKVCLPTDEAHLSKGWSGDIDCATVLFDHLCGFQENEPFQQRPRVWISGPHSTANYEELGELYSWQRNLRQRLGFTVGTHNLRQLVLQDFPLSEADTSLASGKPYVFYTEELPPTSTVTTLPDGSKHGSSTKQLPTYMSDIKKTALWSSNKLKQQLATMLIRLSLLIDTLGTTVNWQCVQVFQHFVLHPNGDIYFAPVSMYTSSELASVPNKTRTAYPYQQVLDILDKDEVRFQNMYGGASTLFLKVVREVCPQYEDELKELLEQELEVTGSV